MFGGHHHGGHHGGNHGGPFGGFGGQQQNVQVTIQTHQQPKAIEFKVTVRPVTHQQHFLFVGNDGSRGHGGDFDVRTHPHQEQRNELIFTLVKENIFTIRSATNPKHILFPSNDGTRAYGQDFDVRTHEHHEARNEWIVDRVDNGYTIRSAVNQNHYLFAANDGSNAFGGDFDVRTHAHHEARNVWLIDNFHFVPETQKVTIRVKSHHQHYLFVGNDGSRGLGNDFDVRTHAHKEARNELLITRVNVGVYSIRSATNTDHYLFPSDDGTRKYGDDFDVRSHPCANENRNFWYIRSDDQGGFIITSATNPSHYLFAANDGSNAFGQDFDVRTHPHQEARNSWLIDGFVLHTY